MQYLKKISITSLTQTRKYVSCLWPDPGNTVNIFDPSEHLKLVLTWLQINLVFMQWSIHVGRD